MPRTGSFLVALSMVAIAASAAVLALTLGGLEAGTSAAVGLALLLAMVLGHIAGQAGADRAAAEARFAELSRATADLAADLAALRQGADRFDLIALDKARAVTEPLAAEMAELGDLVKQFAETLQVHEEAIVRVVQAGGEEPVAAVPAPPPPSLRPAAAPPPPPPVQVLRQQAASLRRRSARPPEPALPEPALPEAFAGLSRGDAVAIIDEAISARRYELFLQPIVTLPQRKVRSYQASVRLRGADGTAYPPEDYRPLAEEAGLMPALDAEVLGRCVQIVRRLTARNRDVGLVCDLSGASLADVAFAAELVDLLEAAQGVAGSLVLGIGQQALRAMSAVEAQTLRLLAEKGFRFAMTAVSDLRIEPRDLAERGVRIVKVPAALMVARGAETGAAIHVADLSGLFARYSIDLVVGEVESESVVVDLLDYEVKLAQGALFSPPRPVRAEVMTTADPAGAAAPAAPPASRTRSEPRPEPRPEPRAEARPAAAPQTLGAAALAAGAVGREARRPGVPPGLRALIRDRS